MSESRRDFPDLALSRDGIMLAAPRERIEQALARSSTFLMSLKPYFKAPTRSAWPGLGTSTRRCSLPGAAEAAMLADRKLYFFYGARTPRDVCGGECLRDLGGFAANIVYIPVVSMPGDGEAWQIGRAHV